MHFFKQKFGKNATERGYFVPHSLLLHPPSNRLHSHMIHDSNVEVCRKGKRRRRSCSQDLAVPDRLHRFRLAHLPNSQHWKLPLYSHTKFPVQFLKRRRSVFSRPLHCTHLLSVLIFPFNLLFYSAFWADIKILCILQITSCVVDYKYSLHGLSVDSNEYGLVLSEVWQLGLHNVMPHS